MVCARFQVTSVTEFAWSNVPKEVALESRYDPSIPEHQRFASAVPSGKFRMIVDNPTALEQFQIGKIFFLEFTPVEEAADRS